jgi:hypothetical protein
MGDTVLVIIGAVVLIMAGQAANARLDLAGIFEPGAGPRHAATSPVTMPLAGMLFEGWPRRAGHLGTLALVATALFALLTAFAGTLSRHRATAAGWVSYAGLNAIGLPVILHVGIGRRWPFRSVSVPREGTS